MDYAVLSLVVILCAAVAALSVAARRLRVASPLLMLVAGAAIAFVPGMPEVALDPDLVLLVLLPPLLYASGVGMTWRGFRSNLRPILLLAIGCVLFTAGAVAAVMHYVLGFSWAVGFVLGAIVSLRPVVRDLGLADAGVEEYAGHQRDERQVRLEAFDAVLQRLDGESGPVAEALHRAYSDRRARIPTSKSLPAPPDTADRCALELRLIDAERQSIASSYEQNRITDEARRRIERELDLEEARVRHALASTSR
jgi:hypothetical protein